MSLSAGFRSWLRIALLLLVGMGLLGLGPADWWIADLLANLRLHTLAALVISLMLLLLMRDLVSAGIAALTATVLLITVGPGGSAEPQEHGNPALTVVSFNLGSPIRTPLTARAYLGATNADVLLLQEYSTEWHAALAPLEETYPFVVSEVRDDNFGIALYSAIPISNAGIGRLDTEVPYVTADIGLDGRTVSVLGLHLQWPMLAETFRARNRQIERIVQTMQPRPNAMLLCGDWNLTPWSRWYDRLLDAGLHDGGFAVRLRATWPDALAWSGIPIDHCLMSAELKLAEKRIPASPGSDHRPIEVTVTYNARQDIIATGAGSPD